jgi:RNA recognition motif-containing protein
MSSGGGGGQQFRYTQTPSKVLHLRNLPWECAEEELVELCKPFGRIINTKSGVGANRNQAFVEFVSPSPAAHSFLPLDPTHRYHPRSGREFGGGGGGPPPGFGLGVLILK